MTELQRLDSICTVIMGQAPKGSTYNEDRVGWPLVAGAGDFDEHVPRPAKYTTQPTKLSIAGDILLGIRASIGGRALADRELCLGRGVAALRAGPNLSSRYLWHWLDSTSHVLAAKARGATFKQVNRQDIGSMLIPVPPIDEQRRIARLLDAADTLRARRSASLVGLRELEKTLVEQMFSAEHNWPMSTVGQMLEFLTSGSRGWAKYYVDAGDLFLRIQNVRENELRLDDVAFVDAPKTQEAKRTRVQAGDVLLSITADLGRTAVIPKALGTAYVNQHLAILRPKGVHPEFLSAGLTSSFGRRQLMRMNRQGVKAGLNFNDVRAVSLPLPSLRKQEEFTSCIAAIRAERSSAHAHLAQLDTLFASLQNRAFKGEL